MSPCSRYHAARVPPQPGQTNPVVYFSRQVGASPAPAAAGRVASVEPPAPGKQDRQAGRRAQNGDLGHTRWTTRVTGSGRGGEYHPGGRAGPSTAGTSGPPSAAFMAVTVHPRGQP